MSAPVPSGRSAWFRDPARASVRAATLLFAAHLAVALALKHLLGVDIQMGFTVDAWNTVWQTLPLDALRTAPLESLWWLHSQPPLYNLYGALLAGVCYPQHMQCMQYANMLMGAGAVAAAYVVGLHVIGRPRLALILAVLLAMSPALFLYEAYPLYDLPVYALVTLSVFCLVRFRVTRRPRWLYTLVFIVNLLILARGLYHLLLLLVVIPFVCMLAVANRRRVLVVALLVSLPSVGWYAKNYFQFGFFGASSWSGLNLWRVTAAGYAPETLRDLAGAGVIDRLVVEVPPFSLPSTYVPYGFDRRSDITVLARDDFNNLNMVDISRVYGDNALRLLRHAPGHFVLNVAKGYIWFSMPTSRLHHLAPNLARIGAYEGFTADVLEGNWLLQRLLGGVPEQAGVSLSWSLLLVPVTLAIYFWRLARRCRLSPAAWRDGLRADAVRFFIAFLLAYTLLISCSLELAENNRYRFGVEAIQWILVVAVPLQKPAGPPA